MTYKPMEEPPHNTVLLAKQRAVEAGEPIEYADVWIRDDHNAYPDYSQKCWYRTGDEVPYTWLEVLAWAQEADCTLVEMVETAAGDGS